MRIESLMLARYASRQSDCSLNLVGANMLSLNVEIPSTLDQVCLVASIVIEETDDEPPYVFRGYMYDSKNEQVAQTYRTLTPSSPSWQNRNEPVAVNLVLPFQNIALKTSGMYTLAIGVGEEAPWKAVQLMVLSE